MKRVKKLGDFQIFSYALLLTLLAIVLFCSALHNKPADLVLGTNNRSNYQIVLPVKANEALKESAQLIQKAFSANNIDIQVVQEDNIDPARPGIYLGDTEFARTNEIKLSQFKDWAYLFRTVGDDLIITGSNNNECSGVVKGVCDFLREYAGTRFLAPGMTGTEFLSMPRISIPANLDISKTPMLKWNYSGNMYEEEGLYNIANNHYFKSIKSAGGHMWGNAVPHKVYFSTHPEYFALHEGQRLDREYHAQYCISNPDVRKLIIEYLIGLNDEGNEIVYLGQPDGFKPCQCEECNKLYGTGDDWEEKVWIFDREIALGVQKERPDARVLILSYQATTHPPKTFNKMPDNAMVLLSHTYDDALDEWSKFEVPAGYAAYLQQFGAYFFTNYLPKRTPAWLEAQAKRFYDMNIIGLNPDAAIYCYGLEGPLYYVWGRMFDDPQGNNKEELLEEYYAAAFREAVVPIRKFFGILHAELEYFSQWLGPRSATHFRIGLDRKPKTVDDPFDWVRVPTSRFGSSAGHRGITDPGQVLSIIYTPEMILGMEKELDQAESLARDEKVKKRLALVRLEMQYLKQVSVVNYLYNAYLIEPEQASLDRLLDALDAWNTMLDSLYDQDGKMKTLAGWPELMPFRNTNRSNLGLDVKFWNRKEKEVNPFAWNIEEVRKNPPHVKKNY